MKPKASRLGRTHLIAPGFIVLTGLICLSTAHAASDTWTPTAAGTFNWNDDANWGTAFPNGTGDTATLGINIAGTQTINLNAPITVGTLNLGDSATAFFSQTLNSGTGGSLIFDVASGSAVLTRTSPVNPNVNDSINTDITLNDDLNVSIPWIAAGNGIILSGLIGGNGGISLTNPTQPAAAASSSQVLDLRNTANSFTGDFSIGNGTVIYRGDVVPSTDSALGNSSFPVKIGGAASLVGTGSANFQSNTTTELRLQATSDTANYSFARDLDFSNVGGRATAVGRARFGITGNGSGGLNTNTLTVSGNIILPEAETGGARGVEFYANRQGQTIRFTGDITNTPGTGSTGLIYFGPSSPGGVNADGRTNGSYRFSDTARTYENTQTLTNGTVIIEGSVGAVGTASPIGTQSISLTDGNGGNLFSTNTEGANRRIFLETAGTSFDRPLSPGASTGTGLTSATINGVAAAIYQPRYGNGGAFNATNGYEIGGLNTSGTTTYTGDIAAQNANVFATGTAGGAGGTNAVTNVHNVALTSVAGGTVDFTGKITGSTVPTLGSTSTPGNTVAANNLRITVNGFRNHQNLDINLDGTADANANALVGTATTGTVILSGDNTYGGTTEVIGGTLLINGSITSNTVTVAAGATLGGTGTINTGVNSSTIQVDGTLAPGASAGTLTSNKSVSFNMGSAFNLEINGLAAADKLVVNDTVLISGGNLTLSLGYAPTMGDAFTVIENDATDAISGTFANLANGGTITSSFAATSYTFEANYAGGTGNDLVLTVIPEPSTALLAALGSLALLRRRSSK